MNSPELTRLITMANQIAAQQDAVSEPAQAADRTARHLQNFWARAMKQQIIAYADAGGVQLSAIAYQAVTQLKAPHEMGES